MLHVIEVYVCVCVCICVYMCVYVCIYVWCTYRNDKLMQVVYCIQWRLTAVASLGAGGAEIFESRNAGKLVSFSLLTGGETLLFDSTLPSSSGV